MGAKHFVADDDDLTDHRPESLDGGQLPCAVEEAEEEEEVVQQERSARVQRPRGT